MKKQGVGARLIRKEDDRYMRGRGEFVGDIRRADMKDVAFVRSPVAHARITSITIPEDIRSSVITSADLVGVKPITAITSLPGFKPSSQPVLAEGKVSSCRRDDRPLCRGRRGRRRKTGRRV